MKTIILALAAGLLAISCGHAQTHVDESVAGYRIGRSPLEKFSLWGVPPVPQQSSTNDLIQSLQAMGLISSGTLPTPLNLNGGPVKAGSVVIGSGSLTLTGSGSTATLVFTSGTLSRTIAITGTSP